jgi:hypothetical protein
MAARQSAGWFGDEPVDEDEAGEAGVANGETDDERAV